MALSLKHRYPRPKTSAFDFAAVDITNNEGKKQTPDFSDSGAVVILFPPKECTKWSLGRLMLTCKVWLLNLIDPTFDKGTEFSVSEQA